MNNFKASIIIPNFNGAELLQKNLPSVIAAWKNKENKIKEVIIVDDASSDDSVKLLKNEFPEITLIRHKKNRGFSSAINTGVRSAKGDLMVLLNSDVSPSNNFLEIVLPHFNKTNVFAVSFHEEGFGWARGFYKEGFVEHEQGALTNNMHETFWVNGGSSIFRRDYWVKLGGLDEKLFSPFYWEDIDICYRAQKRGFICLWLPKAKVTHEHEKTIAKLPKKYVENIRERNQLLFIWKNITSPSLTRRHFVGLFQRIIKHPGYIKIVFRALIMLPLVLKARRKERKETKVSDEAIFAKYSG